MGSLAVNPVWKFGDRLQRMLAQSSSQWCFFQCRHSGVCNFHRMISIAHPLLVSADNWHFSWLLGDTPYAACFLDDNVPWSFENGSFWDGNGETESIYIYIYLSLIDPVIICYIYNWNCTGKYGPGLWSCLQNLLFTCFFTSCVQLFNRLFLDGKSFTKPISHGRGYVPWKEWFFPELPDINIPILVVVNAYIRVIRDNHQYVASIHLLGFYIARPGEEEGPREIPRPSLKLEQLRQFGRWALVV